jgi:hypothetical protein
MPHPARIAAALLLSFALHGSANAGLLTKGSISRGNSNGCTLESVENNEFVAPPAPVYVVVDSLQADDTSFLEVVLTVTGDTTPIEPTFSTRDLVQYDPPYYYLLYADLVPGTSYTVDIDCPGPSDLVRIWFDVLAGPCSVPLPEPTTNLLWTDLGDSRTPLGIERLKLGASQRTTIAEAPALASPEVLAVEPVAGWIYVGDDGLDAIVRMRPDGSDPTTLVSGVREPRDLVYGTYGSGAPHLYWVDEYYGEIRRAYLTAFTIYTVTSVSSPVGALAFDPVEDKLYWSEPSLDRIRRCDDDGANVETFLSVAEGIRQPGGLSIDADGRKLYWVNGLDDSIRRTDLMAPAAHEVIADPQDGVGSAHRLAYDGDTGILYFTDTGTNAVRRIPAAGVVQDVVSTGLGNVRALTLERRPVEIGGTIEFMNGSGFDLVQDFGECTPTGPTIEREVAFSVPVAASGSMVSTCPEFVIDDPYFDFQAGGGWKIVNVTYAPQGPGVHVAELFLQTDQNWLTNETRRLMVGSSTLCASLPPTEPCRYPDSVLDDTTGEDIARMLRRPDEVSAKIRDNTVTLSFECALIVDGTGPDFNVYELSEAPAEFDEIDVLVSDDGMSFVSVKASEGVWVDIDGDELHQDSAFARSYDLAGVLSQAGWVRIQGLPAGAIDGFDLDAVGIIHGASDCNDNLVDDGCELATEDADGDLVLDVCEPDCDGDGIADADEIAAGAPDVNVNAIPDDCDADCDTDGIIDAAEPGVFDLSSNDCRFPATLVENTTGHAPDAMIGAPDDVALDLGGQRLTYRLDCSLIVDGPGPDFNVYELDTGDVEFGRIEVYVSENGTSFHRVTESEGPAVPIAGDEAHGDPAFARSYRLDGTGLSQARYVKIDADGDTSAGFGLGFDLDALGVIHAGADANGDGILDVCQTGTTTPPATSHRNVLHPARPNPFNPRTTLRFELSQPARVDLTVYDLAGRRVKTLLESEPSQAGTFEMVWNGTDDLGLRVASGVYLVRMRAGAFEAIRRVTLLK